jgi:hypothetical protein
MNEIARRPQYPTRMVAGVAVPLVSPGLRDMISTLSNPHPDAGADMSRLTDDTKQEAARLLPVMDRLLVPATTEDWRRFMAPARRLLPKAPSEQSEGNDTNPWLRWCGGAAWSMPDMPAVVLTEARSRAVATRFKFWPTPHELSEWLAPHAAALLAERRAMSRIASAGEIKRPEPVTEEMREAFTSRLKSLKAEIRADEQQREEALRGNRPAPAAKPLSEGMLEAAYRQQIADGGPFADLAKLRLNALLAKRESV